MGSVISAAGKFMSEETDKACKATNAQNLELLNAMSDAVKAKLELWKTSVLLSGKTDKKVTLERIIAQGMQIKVSANFNDKISKGETKGDLFQGIKAAAKDFTDEKYVDGIANGLETVIGAVIGSSSGSSNESDTYILVVGDNAALNRIDYYVYFRKVVAGQMFSSELQEMLGVAYIVSSVNWKDVDPMTVKSIVEHSCASLSPEEKQKLEDKIKSSLDEARDHEKKISPPKERIVHSEIKISTEDQAPTQPGSPEVKSVTTGSPSHTTPSAKVES